MSTQTITRPATDAQLRFVNSLRTERGLDTLVSTDTEWVNLTTRDASAVIDALKSMPRQQLAKAPTAEVEAGVYIKGDGSIYRVYRGQSGRMLAKKIDEFGAFTYQGAAYKYVTADEKITREQAAKFGQETGVCCMCGRELTDPESVSRGIGPICEGRF